MFRLTLKKLHAWNAITLLLLTVSGIVLYVPSIRGELGAARVILKQVHIGLGFVSVLLILLYLPFLRKHWRQLRNKLYQQANLLFVLALLLGWIVSGIVLWQIKLFPSPWTGTALLWHDLLTWVGVPYVVYHSVSRSRWLKRQGRRSGADATRFARSRDANITASAKSPAQTRDDAGTAASSQQSQFSPESKSTGDSVMEALKNSPISRRTVLRAGIGLLLVAGVGPTFYRWMKSALDDGGANTEQLAASDGNVMLPEPTPLPDSKLPLGGGARGNFRVYTVTEIPAFTSDHWQFALSGLVDKPKTWDWKSFLELPRKVQVSDFHCVTGWSVYSVTWEGIPLSQFLEQAGVKSSARYAKFYSGDGVYTDTLSLEQAGMEDVMIAVLMDGKPIPQQLGGPVRLVVPQMYAYKSVKWLQAVELIEQEHIGYWELRGYDQDAWVRT